MRFEIAWHVDPILRAGLSKHLKVSTTARLAELMEMVARWVNRDPVTCSRSSLVGITLGCWCKPRPCHGDVPLELVVEMPTGQGV